MKQTLKIGDKVKVIKTEEIVTIKSISTSSNGKMIKGFYDEKHRYWSFLLDQLQLIKPKSKKVKKWNNSRKELADWINELDINYKKIIIEKLLATQPQPIKEDKLAGGDGESGCSCGNCGKIVGAIGIGGCRCKQEDNKECKKAKPFRDYVVGFNNNPTPSPLEESKDIEFEEIEELNLTQIFLIDMSLTEIFKNSLFQINERLTRLIRNQNLIIKQLKQK